MELWEKQPCRLVPEMGFSQTPLSTTALSRLHRCFRQGRRFFPKLARVLCPHPLSSHPVSSPFLSPPTHLHQNPSRGVDSAVSGPRLSVRRQWVKEIFLAEKSRLVVIYIRLLTFHLDKTWRLFLSKNNKWQKQMLKKRKREKKHQKRNHTLRLRITKKNEISIGGVKEFFLQKRYWHTGRT